MLDQFKVVWCWATSFLKSEWKFEDYPIRVREQKDVTPIGHFLPIRWTANVINNYRANGYGQTREEALESLRKNFMIIQESEGPFPRPGLKVPVQFAASDEIERHSEFASDFMNKILDQNLNECFISDESSLWDFCDDDDLTGLFEKIKATYGKDVSDISNGNLLKLFICLDNKSSGS